jgi:hypothetical protein
VSLHFQFRFVMSVTISVEKRYSVVHLYLQLFVVGLMSYLRYLCMIAHSGVHHILCCVFVLFFFVYVASFSGLSILIAPSVFSNVFK